MGSASGRRTGRPASSPEGDLDFGALGRALWRKRWRIMLPTLIVGAVSVVGVNYLTPKYKSEARILYEGRENIFLRPEADKATQDRGIADQEAVASQVELVLSRQLASDVIRDLKLNERPEFDPLLAGISPLKYALVLLGISRDPTRMSAQERVLESYYAGLTAYPVDRARVIVVEFKSTDPDIAAKVTNAVAKRYLTLQQVAKQDQTRAAGQWLAGEIDSLRAKVAEAEAKAEAFRSQSNLFVGTNNTTLSNQQLGEFNTQLGAARAQKSDAESRARLIRDIIRRGDQIEASDVINSELMRRLAEQRVTLQAQLAEQSSTLLERHPRIKELRAQIADLDRQMRGEAEKLVRALENEARIASAKLDSLNTSLDQLKRQAASTNEQDVQFRALEREARAQRELLESYLARYRETTARDTIASAPSDARIISPAVASSTPYFPKKLPIVLIATLTTFVLCLAFVLTGEVMKGGPSLPATWSPPLDPSMEDIADEGVTTADADDVVQAGPEAAPRERGLSLSSIEALARSLGARGEEARAIVVAGLGPAFETTVIAVTLARALARGRRVVLVELSPGGEGLSVVARRLGAPGLAELARASASFGEIILRDRHSPLHLVTAGQGGETGLRLDSPRVALALSALTRSYDHVVIDAGCACEEVAARAIAPLSPIAVLVAERGDGRAIPAREWLARAGARETIDLPGLSAEENPAPGARRAA